MKKMYIVKIFIYCFFILFVTHAQAQLVTAGTGPFFGQTDPGPLIESIGIGDFAAPGLSPLSAFHINTNLLGFALSYNAGEVFRTDCPMTDGVNDISTFWRMYRGGVQYGKLYNLVQI